MRRADALIDQVLCGLTAREALEAIQRRAIVSEADQIRRQSHAQKRDRPLDQRRSRAAKAGHAKNKPAYSKGTQKYHQSAKGKSNMRKLARYNTQGRAT